MTVIKDQFQRQINYLRISITDRCNLRCQYCMPQEGVEYKPHSQIMRYEDILKLVKVSTDLGIKKIRITGGEPLVRKDAVKFVSMLSEVRDLEEIALTTNGLMLNEYAAALRKAGLNRVNISLDTLQNDRFKKITGSNALEEVYKGIEAALASGLDPVKINTVVMSGINDDEIEDFVELTRSKKLHVRFIEYMPFVTDNKKESSYYPLEKIKKKIKDKHEIKKINLKGSGPAEYYKISSYQGTIGFISPISHSFCRDCNRIRLTADGKLKPCLSGEKEVDLYNNKREISGEQGLKRKLFKSIMLKPESHSFSFDDLTERNMFEIGG